MKRFTSIIIAVLCMLLTPTVVHAVNWEPSNLTVIMKYGDVTLSGINVAVCRVANAKEVKGVTVYEAVQDFSGIGADFSNLTTDKNIALAASLDAYASVNDIERSINITDNNGKAVFSGLSAGLYLVAQKDVENSEYIIAPYLVALPNLNETGDGWNYNVTAAPKTEPVKRDGDTISVSVHKIWAGTDSHPGNILVQLYRNSQPYGNTISLTDGNYWSYTWDGLDPDDIWTVDEFDVPAGYTKTISGSSSTGYIITNTKTTISTEKIIIEGNKSWYHRTRGDEVYIPEEEKPTSITLNVLADGELILQKLITADDRWSWSIEMDKYAEDGHEIVYSVDEERFEDYRKWVVGTNGFSIINEYSPGDNTMEIPDIPPPLGPPDDGPDGPRNPNISKNPSGPKTEDASNMQLWVIQIVVGFVGLFAVLCILNSKRILHVFTGR